MISTTNYDPHKLGESGAQPPSSEHAVLRPKEFYWQCAKHAVGGKWRILEVVELVAVLVLTPFSFWDKTSLAVPILIWAVPVSVFALTIAAGFVTAPYSVYKPVAERLQWATVSAPFPKVEIEKHKVEQRQHTLGDGRISLLMILHKCANYQSGCREG